MSASRGSEYPSSDTEPVESIKITRPKESTLTGEEPDIPSSSTSPNPASETS